MKNVSVVITRDAVKKNIAFYKFWVLVFFALIIISSSFKGMVFIYHSAGLFLALVYWYFNNKSLQVKGIIISKTVMSEDSFKGSSLLSKATFIGWIILSGIVINMIAMSRPEMLIDTLFFFVFVLLVLYKRMRLSARKAVQKKR
ncbi:MAG: hypothetical protein V1678_02170 [Candidatus Aenigmatarchaeota archaeon]